MLENSDANDVSLENSLRFSSKEGSSCIDYDISQGTVKEEINHLDNSWIDSTNDSNFGWKK